MGAFNYIGRFAPSPTGPLHAGSLVAALASWLDARAHGGTWLVRIEDVDKPRCLAAMEQHILTQLGAFGLVSDEPPWVQSRRTAAYRNALAQLAHRGLAYPCRCSRRDIDAVLKAQGHRRSRNAELVYPGTCRPATRTPITGSLTEGLAWRLRTDCVSPGTPVASVPGSPPAPAPTSTSTSTIQWTDRRLGLQSQEVEAAVGDFALLRADGCTTYQLAVVVDDAAQGISHVVRGEDLADNTPRQILLQRQLGLPTPVYLHTPLVLGLNGEKLSKQSGAKPLQTEAPLIALNQAAIAVGLPASECTTVGDALGHWAKAWRHLYNLPGD